MKKYNVVNYVRWKKDITASIRALPAHLKDDAENSLLLLY